MKGLWKKIRYRLDYRARGLAPRRLAARLNGPTVVANAVPRSGTHLLMQSLMAFPHLSYSGLHYVAGEPDVEAVGDYLRRTGKGRFMGAHLYYSDEVAGLLKERSVINILQIRDPRDVIVSTLFFALKRKGHFWKDYLGSLPDRDAQIRIFITGNKNPTCRGDTVPSIRKTFDAYMPWIDKTGCLLMKFENLIGSGGGGDAELQRREIERLAHHVGLPPNARLVGRIAEKTFSAKSITFRKGAIGGWREHFSAGNTKLFNELHADLMNELGYEI